LGGATIRLLACGAEEIDAAMGGWESRAMTDRTMRATVNMKTWSAVKKDVLLVNCVGAAGSMYD
jgi:hypothetical protein